jgi:hypothetical protein
MESTLCRHVVAHDDGLARCTAFVALRYNFQVVLGTRGRWVGLASIAYLLAICGSASAQYGLQPAPAPPPAPVTNPSSADLERARTLFAEGLAFVAQEDWQSAADRFTQVHDIRSSPVVSYKLASALTRLGRLVESSKLLTQVLSDVQADEETRGAAQLLLSKIEPSIGAITINVYGNAEGCRFALDEQPIDVPGGAVSLRVDVGQHRVVVERDGAAILSPEVTVGGAFPMHAQLSLEIPARVQAVALMPSPPPRPAQPALHLRQASPPPRDDASLWEQWWVWAGAGAVVAGAVITTLLLTSSDDPQPITGTTDPPVIRTRVLGVMR